MYYDIIMCKYTCTCIYITCTCTCTHKTCAKVGVSLLAR